MATVKKGWWTFHWTTFWQPNRSLYWCCSWMVAGFFPNFLFAVNLNVEIFKFMFIFMLYVSFYNSKTSSYSVLLFWHHFLVQERVQVSLKKAKKCIKNLHRGWTKSLSSPQCVYGVELAGRLHQNNYPLNSKTSFQFSKTLKNI